jgi:hypothetical protein
VRGVSPDHVTGHGTVSAGIAREGGRGGLPEKPVDEEELLGGIRRRLQVARRAPP